MNALSKSQRKSLKFIVDGGGENLTLANVLWMSRWALLQWGFVFAVGAFFLIQVGATRLSGILVAFGLGALTAQIAGIRNAIENWKVLRTIVDVDEAKRLLASHS